MLCEHGRWPDHQPLRRRQRACGRARARAHRLSVRRDQATAVRRVGGGSEEDDRRIVAMAWFGRPLAPAKSPLKVNVFAHMMGHHGMLEQIPLFPYLGPGDIVLTAALSLSLPETPRVYFYHYNV